MAEATMGVPNSKPSDKLRTIHKEVNSLRSSVRGSNRKLTNETKDHFVQALVQCSNEANSLKGKVKPKLLEQVQSNISHTMEDILSTNPKEPDLDMGAVETSSFVQLPLSKRQTSNKDLSAIPSKKPKSQVDFAKRSISTLQDIEDKLNTLKPQISVAIEQKDLTQLRVHQGTIKVLVTDLEMIEVREHTPLDEKKKKLDKSIMSQHQKITKAMKEIRRDKDINYLVKQNKRSTDELEDIQRELLEIESAIPTILKSGDLSAMNGLRENMVIIKQRLSSVHTVDERTKQIQMQLLRRFGDISEDIDNYTKGSSQSDLTKAQMNYEELIKNIASGNSLDKDEIKVKLQSLQSFINSIKEDNENVSKGKQQLLNNVRQSFSFILEEPKIENTDVQYVKKEENQGLKELNNLFRNLKSFEKSINTSSLDDLSTIYNVLSDMQESIEKTKHQIAEHSSLPANLNKKLNRSVPNLSSPKSLHSKYGSSISVDQASQSLLRAKVKVYNIPTPQVQNINDQPVVLRNKRFYNSSVNPDDPRPFSKIEEIKTQVNYIKEKYNESQQKQHLKNKLESYVEIINGYVHHQNQRIANSAKSLLAEIQDMLGRISHIPESMNAASQRRASIELSLENIVGIQGSVEQLERAVSSFEGRKDDPQYKKLSGELLECRMYLQSIEIPPKYNMVLQQREEILNRVAVALNVLESKCFNSYENTQLENTNKKLNILKEKVNRFTGAYKGVLYNQIEKDLNKLLVDVTESVDDKVITDDITKNIEKYLKILEHRSTKDQSFRRVSGDVKFRNEEEEKLLKLKSDLLNIKTSIDTTPTNAVNLFMGLKSRLDLVKLGLDQLRFTLEEEEKQKDILYNEVETLKNVVEAKISLARQAVRQWPLEQDKEKLDLEELGKIEEKFKTLKPEIESFAGTTSDNKFYELDENSIRLILKMDKLQFERGSEAHKRKIDLLKEIYTYGDLLDQRAKESEDLLEIERGIHDIEKNFARNVKLNDLESLQEKVVTLKTRISNGQFNNNLLQRKQECIKKIEALFAKITAVEKENTQNIQQINMEKSPDHIISNIELQFGNIKKEIDIFSGTRAHKKYYDLNSKLTALLLELDNLQLPHGSELRSRKIVLLKEMRMYTEILSSKANDCEYVLEVEQQLNYINKKVDSYKGTPEELKKMEEELKSVQAKMDKIRIGDDHRKPIEQKFDILVGEYSRLKKAKETRKTSTSSNTFYQEAENGVAPNTGKAVIGNRLAEIENEIYLVRRKVTTFINTDSSEEYKTIEDTLLRLKMRLNKLETERNSEFSRKKHELEEAIEECFNILDERSLDTLNIMEIEDALDRISRKLQGQTRPEERSAVDEKLIYLQVRLGKLRVNEDLVQRKNQCADRIINYLKMLKGQTVAGN